MKSPTRVQIRNEAARVSLGTDTFKGTVTGIERRLK